MNKTKPLSYSTKQKGAALIIFALTIIAIAAGAYVISNKNTASHINNQTITSKSLGLAKKALENFFISYMPTGVSNEIGRLPYPDRGNDAAGYDGKSDCINYTAALDNNLLLGHFPWLQEEGSCTVIDINTNVRDGAGERLWYSVAPPMVRHSNNSNLGPNILNSNNFITIYDQLGNVISDRVAFVIISAGTLLPGQNRSNTAISNFLDSFNVPGIGIVNNFDTDLTFIKAPESNSFNDRLIFMTIDELMPTLENRVLSEFIALLTNHFNTFNVYPYPAQITFTSPDQDPNNLYDCDTSFSPGGGLFANRNLGPLNQCPANNPILNIPAYLHSWIQYIIYEPRPDCVNPDDVPACNVQPVTSLTVDGTNGFNFVLLYTGAHDLYSGGRADYLTDMLNQTDNQEFVTPTIAPIPANQDIINFQ